MKTLTPKQTALFLDETGLAFEINRRILHPLGLALRSDEEGEVYLAQTDAPEGFVQTAAEVSRGIARHKRMMTNEGSRRVKLRREALGYVIQGDGDPPSQRSTPRH